MNQREAFRAICRFEPVADMPLWQFQGCMGGVLPETLDRWVNEESFRRRAPATASRTIWGSSARS